MLIASGRVEAVLWFCCLGFLSKVFQWICFDLNNGLYSSDEGKVLVWATCDLEKLIEISSR